MQRNDSNLFAASSTAGVLLAILCAMTSLSGVSQQHFEWVQLPQTYAAILVAQGSWLRALIAVDDLFIAAYVMATITLAQRIAGEKWGLLTIAIAGGGIAAGVLDLHENHDLLVMLRLAEFGAEPSTDGIAMRSELSQLKWMIGHLAFVGVGVAWPRRDTWLDRVLVGSLIVVQLPIGTLVWTLDDPVLVEVAIWMRYASFLSGFFTIAWLARRANIIPGFSTPSEAATSARA